jgi:RNA 3'-terminal phosphate cyclase (ATP)
MIVIDGSFGEGGGQILRSALALSLITGKPFKIENIRSRRSRPGLMRQHLTAVCAAMDVGEAEVKGAEIGSSKIEFRPKSIRTGDFHFAVGTAGSATLVLQTVLPALLTADRPSRLVLEGGTHNPYAPPFDFLEKAFLPLVRKMGPKVQVNLDRPGFYPAGGGRFTVNVTPTGELEGIEIMDRGALVRCHARALIANLPKEIGERELATLEKRLKLRDDTWRVEEVAGSQGPGNVLMVEVAHENAAELFTGFGERRVRSETVAERVAKQVNRYLAAGAPVGPHLADQLLLPMAMAGAGRFKTVKPTKHTSTNIAVIERFLSVAFSIEALERDLVEIELRSR